MVRQRIRFIIYSFILPYCTYAAPVIGYKKLDLKNLKTIAHTLEFSPSTYCPEIILGIDGSIGLETVESMKMRHDAIAALNGGFFQTGLALGAPLGLLVTKKIPISRAIKGRGAIGWARSGGKTLIDQLDLRIQLYIGHNQILVSRFNEPLSSQGATLYSHHFSRTTLSPEGTSEYLLTKNKKISYLGNLGNQEIPLDCYILSIPGKQRNPLQIRESFYYLNFEISAQIEKSNKSQWQHFDYILQAGPILLKNRLLALDLYPEPIEPAIGPKKKRARTAIGIKPNGNWLVVVCEASGKTKTEGLTLKELADLLFSLGCTDAINLDGGGSATLLYEGKKFFSPSQIPYPFSHQNVIYMPKEGPRPVGNGIIIKKKAPK